MRTPQLSLWDSGGHTLPSVLESFFSSASGRPSMKPSCSWVWAFCSSTARQGESIATEHVTAQPCQESYGMQGPSSPSQMSSDGQTLMPHHTPPFAWTQAQLVQRHLDACADWLGTKDPEAGDHRAGGELAEDPPGYQPGGRAHMGTPVHGCGSWATAMGLLRVHTGRARKEVK